jgi:hypothetical protein
MGLVDFVVEMREAAVQEQVHLDIAAMNLDSLDIAAAEQLGMAVPGHVS